MTEARAISAQLVDIRNVGTHKVVKLTLHAPEEHALRIMELFGWPTGVNPVPVAIARMQTAKEVQPEATTLSTQSPSQQPPSPQVPRIAEGEAERRKFSDMKPSQQAGMLSNDEAFQKFLIEKFGGLWSHFEEIYDEHGEAEIAAAVIRYTCKVDSRADIKPDNVEWSSLVLAYRLWQNHPELEDA